jgi:serralysin
MSSTTLDINQSNSFYGLPRSSEIDVLAPDSRPSLIGDTTKAYGQPYYIEALLLADQPRWASDGIIGGSPGNPVTLTYSFMEQLPAYYQGAGYDYFWSFTAAERNFARQALATWSDVANVTFQEVPDTGDGGTLRFGETWEDSSAIAWCYTPCNSPVGGDIWLNWFQDATHDLAPRTDGFLTLIHEMGHSLGLQDTSVPEPGTVLLPDSQENNQYTVMSYNDHPSTWGAYALTPLLYDIAAVQYLYGANTTTHAGDTVYSWNPNTTTIEAIWDGGGNDTISAANQTTWAVIDLRTGHFSSIGQDIDISTGATYGDAVNNIAIAFGVTIENAVGSDGNDQICGNSVANMLTGGAGNDSLLGLAGNDTLTGNVGNDWLSGDVGSDKLEGNQGNDKLYGNAGNDSLCGGAGKNKVWGGTGRDMFLLVKGAGYDTIFDFRDRQDRFRLGAGMSFRRLNIIDRGNNVWLMYGGDLLAVVKAADVGDFTSADFR